MEEAGVKVYIFRGAPASGKGTVAPEFCKLLPGSVALIEQDKFRWGLHLIGRTVPDISDEEHRFAHENTLHMYERYLQHGGYTVVIEGLFTWDEAGSSQGNAAELIELARQYDALCTSVVLKADKDVLLARNASRKYTVPKDEFEKLYESVYQSVGPDEIVIDSTDATAEATLEELRQRFMETA